MYRGKEKLLRVIWRLEERGNFPICSRKQLRLAIMEECGIREITIKSNISAMKELGLIKNKYGHVFEFLVNRDDEEIQNSDTQENSKTNKNFNVPKRDMPSSIMP